MVIKAGAGVVGACARRGYVTNEGEVKIELIRSRRAGRNLRQEAKHRIKDLSKTVQCGGSAWFLSDLRATHRIERRFLTIQLSELVLSGGYQADLTGMVSYRAEPLPARVINETRTVCVIGPKPKMATATKVRSARVGTDSRLYHQTLRSRRKW